MADFFLELFSEEIPARMQKNAAAMLLHWVKGAQLNIHQHKVYYGPRRIALAAIIDDEKPGSVFEARGPRENAPEAAIAGFLKKAEATREELVVRDGYFTHRRSLPAVSARDILLTNLPGLLRTFGWPKSMRWGSGGDFTWVRPLRRIVCLLDGEIIPFTLGPVTAGNETEGHRVHGPGPFAVSSAAVWEEKLREHKVIVNQDERQKLIADGMAEKAAALDLSVVLDEGLLEEVTGLVEWPVPLIGRIDDDFMSLPPEVRELSMKINQKYFALRDATGLPAPYFAFVANLEAEDQGKAIIAGNERVLRARLADARHFWDLDLKTPLNELLPKLEKITFHAKIGTQNQRAYRIANLAREIAELLGADGFESNHAYAAGHLAKADLVTGMVGEFPELQGVMGGYYAKLTTPAYTGLDGLVLGQAIGSHYQPKGASDNVPTGIVPCAVALADKLDTLREFFRIGEKPTGSGDPYALRRCALGVIRIVLENNLRLPLKPLLTGDDGALFDFIIERLRVKLRGEGKRFDILDAVLAAGSDDDLVRVMKKVDALTDMLGTEDGKNLLAAYKRAANIVSKEEAKTNEDFDEEFDEELFVEAEEGILADGIKRFTMNTDLATGAKIAGVHPEVSDYIEQERYPEAMAEMALLRPAIDAFFEKVTVNADPPELRRNRLRLLARFVAAVQQVADFTKIEG